MSFSSYPIRVVVFFLAATMVLAGSVAGQTLPDNAAFSILRSETKIHGELVTRSGVAFQFTTRDGEMLRISELDLDYDLAVALTLEADVDAEAAQESSGYDVQVTGIKLAELEIRQHPSGGGEAVHFRADNIQIEVGTPYFLSDGHEIRIDQIGRAKPGLGKSINVARLAEDRPVPEKGVCCITCGGVTVCGCSVSSSCGSCCSGSCCGGGVGGFNEN